jgi:hypothetical protein
MIPETQFEDLVKPAIPPHTHNGVLVFAEPNCRCRDQMAPSPAVRLVLRPDSDSAQRANGSTRWTTGIRMQSTQSR